jgi:hypothetical protein
VTLKCASDAEMDALLRHAQSLNLSARTIRDAYVRTAAPAQCTHALAHAILSPSLPAACFTMQRPDSDRGGLADGARRRARCGHTVLSFQDVARGLTASGPGF